MFFLFIENYTYRSRNYKKNKIIKDTSLNLYETQINNLTSKYNKLKGCIFKILDIIVPFKIDKKIITLEECVEKSFLNTKTKNQYCLLLEDIQNTVVKNLNQN